jgi:hypothetical protein
MDFSLRRLAFHKVSNIETPVIEAYPLKTGYSANRKVMEKGERIQG